MGQPVYAVRNGHNPDLPGVTWTQADLMLPGAGEALVRDLAPDVVIYAAGLTNVDGCEQDEARAHRLHCLAAKECLSAAAAIGGRAVHISTDHLWRGDTSMVSETTPPEPLNAYARTKRAGELAVIESVPDALIIRTNFFGWGLPWRQSLSDWLLNEFAAGRIVNAFVDTYFTPIEMTLLSKIITTLAEQDATGIFHVAGSSRLSKHDFAVQLAKAFGYSQELIKPVSLVEHQLIAPRPRDMSLATEKLTTFLGAVPPDIDTCIQTLADAAPARITTDNGEKYGID